jgi:hypothetical protein
MTLEIFRLFGRTKRMHRTWLPVAKAVEECAYGICMKADIQHFLNAIDRLSRDEGIRYVDWARPRLEALAKENRRRYLEAKKEMEKYV